MWWYTSFGDQRKYLNADHFYRSRLILPEKAICKLCGSEYVKPRKRGRPPEYCSEECTRLARIEREAKAERIAFAKALRE